MEMLQQISTLIGSGGLVGIITAYVTKRNTDRNHKTQYVVQERQKWREDIRTKMEEVTNTYSRHEVVELLTFFQLRLNP